MNQLIRGFNSTMVRLKADHVRFGPSQVVRRFQFHNGSIKSVQGGHMVVDVSNLGELAESLDVENVFRDFFGERVT